MDGGADSGQDGGQKRFTIQEAARYLGVSEGAIRKRVARGTLAHDKDSDGRVYVHLDARDRQGVDAGQDEGVYPEPSALTSEMRARIDDLKEQLEAEREANRENRRIIAALASRIPELEAAQEPPESPENASEEPARGEEQRGAQEPISRPWWRRWWPR